MEEIEDGLIVNLLASLVISLLISIERQIPPHKRKARAIIKVEESIKELARLNSLPITEELVTVGVRIWNSCIEELQRSLENMIDSNNEVQFELFSISGNDIIYFEYYNDIN
jgi:hypothetical protein